MSHVYSPYHKVIKMFEFDIVREMSFTISLNPHGKGKPIGFYDAAPYPNSPQLYTVFIKDIACSRITFEVADVEKHLLFCARIVVKAWFHRFGAQFCDAMWCHSEDAFGSELINRVVDVLKRHHPKPLVLALNVSTEDAFLSKLNPNDCKATFSNLIKDFE